MKLYIIDAAYTNLASLRFSLERLAYKAEISRDLEELRKADKFFSPGVDIATTAMKNLEKFGLCGFIKSTQKPLLGICLGIQILGDLSEELEQKTLGIIPFKTLRFEEKGSFSLSYMGWNEIRSEGTLFKGLDEAYFYFVHSRCTRLSDYTTATCEYSKPFSAAVRKGNFYGVQFHPERSGEAGGLLLENLILL